MEKVSKPKAHLASQVRTFNHQRQRLAILLLVEQLIDMGGASGALTLSAINTASTFTLDTGSAPKLDVNAINNITASAGITLTLGAVNESTKQLSVSAAETGGAFVLNAGAYRSPWTLII